MEYGLGRLYNAYDNRTSKIEILEYITEEQFKQFQEYLAKIEELHSVRRLRDFVVGNDQELIDCLNASLNHLTHQSISFGAVKRADADRVLLDTNRLLLNYLSSMKTFLDHSETFLNRKFGKTSAQFLEFKQMNSAFFNNSFAYRFFYNLRNYAQHVGVPIHGINFSADHDPANNSIKGTLEIKFDRDKLLASFSDWKHVKADLERCEPRFDLTPLLFEMTHNIVEIERNFELIFKDGLIEAANFITAHAKHIRDEKSEVFIAFDFKDDENGKSKGFEQINIPFATIDFILSSLV